MGNINGLSVNNKEYLYVEKYRPKSIDDIVLDETTRTNIKNWIKDGEIPNLLLSGRTPGTGKTSLCHVLINEIGADALFVNASLESNIDLLRSKIQGFVSTAGFESKPKIVILDEADFLNPNSTQPALRGFIEQFSKNARFILTCNYKNKLIEPLRNRLIDINFDDMTTQHKGVLQKQTALRTIKILENEGIKYDKQDLVWIIRHYFPSSRRIINSIQELSSSGTLVIDKNAIDQDGLALTILSNIISQEFKALRQNIAKLPDPSVIFNTLYDGIDDFPEGLQPKIIIAIAKYQAFDSQVRDRLINAVACCVEVMDILQKA